MSNKEGLDNMEKILKKKPSLASVNRHKKIASSKNHSSWQDIEKILNEFPPKIKTAEASVQTGQDDFLPELDGFIPLAGSSKQEPGSDLTESLPNSSQLETNKEDPNDPEEVSAQTSKAIPSLAGLNLPLEENQPHAIETQANLGPVLTDSLVCLDPNPVRHPKDEIPKKVFGYLKRKWLSIIWIVVCFAAMVYHMHVTTNKYFEYEVTSTTSIQLVEEFSLPAFSFCLRIDRIKTINNGSCSDSHSSHNSSCLDQLMYDYPYSAVINNFTIGLSEIIRYLISDQLGEKTDVFFKPPFKCFKFLMNNNLNTNIHSNLILIAVVVRSTPIFDIFIHDPQTLVTGKDQPSFSVQGNMLLILHLEKFSMNYLPSPYKFNCMDYPKFNLNSKEECIEKCIRKKYNIDLDIYTYSTFNRNQTSKLIKFPLYEPEYLLCSSKCYVNCKTNIYFFNVRKQTIFRDPKAGIGVFHSNLFADSSFSPSFTLINYIIFIASIGSLWIGFAIYVSIKQFTIFLFINSQKYLSMSCFQHSKYKMFVEYFFFSCCLTGTIYHSLSLTEDYMKYEFKSSFSLESNNNRFPAFSIALETFEWKSRMEQNAHDVIFSQRRYLDTFEKLGFQTENGFQWFNFTEHVFIVTEFTANYQIYQRIEFNISNLISFADCKNIFSIVLRGQYNCSLKLMFDDPKIFPRNPKETTILKNTKIYKSFISTLSVQKLQFPYRQNCKNYFEDGLESVDECKDKCFQNHFKERMPTYLPHRILFTKKDFNTNDTFANAKIVNVTNPKAGNELRRIRSELFRLCHKACSKPDCSHKIYVNKFYHSYGNEYLDFELRPNHYQQLIVYSPNLSFLKYLLFLSSIFGLWSGISIYSLFDIFKTFKNLVKTTFYSNTTLSSDPKIFKLLYISICLISMAFHFFNNSRNYFLYKVTNEILLETKHSFDELHENICFDMVSIMTNDIPPTLSFCKSNISRVGSSKERCYIDLSKVNFKNLSYDLTQNPLEMIEKVLVLENNEFYEYKGIQTLQSVFKVYMKYPYKCILYSLSSYKKQPNLKNKIHFKLKFNNKFQLAKLFEHHPIHFSSLPYFHHDDYDFLDLAINQTNLVNYKVTRSRSMCAPVTNCFNYDKNPHKSRDECIDTCIRMNSFGLNFIQMIHFVPFKNDHFYQNNTHFAELNSKCIKKCPEDCRVEIFDMTPYGYELAENNSTGYAKRNTFYTITSTYSLEFPLLEYIISLAEITGLWFGLAIISIGFNLASFVSGRIHMNIVSPM